MGEIRNEYKILVGKPEGKTTSEDQGVDWRTILKWILGKWRWRVWIEFIWLRIGTSGRFL
jgi:hypothetical protein